MQGNEPQTMHELLANRLWFLGEATPKQINQEFPEWSEMQVENAIRKAAKYGLVRFTTVKRGHRMVVAKHNPCRSVFELANHV